MVAILTAATFDLCHAEDWAVNGQTYHNVKITGKQDLDADAVSITFDGTASQPQTAQIKLADLPSERITKIRTIQKEMMLKVALMIYFESSGPVSRFERYRQERPKAVEELSKHPQSLVGTVMCGENGMYLIKQEAGSGQKTNGVPGSKINYCYLLQPKQPYQDNEKLNLKVFSASIVEFDGIVYQCYSDDPTKAYNLSHDLN